MSNLVSTEEYISTLRTSAQVIENQQRQLESLTPRAEGFDAIIAILSLTNHGMHAYGEDWASALRRKISAIEQAQDVEAEAGAAKIPSEDPPKSDELLYEQSVVVERGILYMRLYRKANGELLTVATLDKGDSFEKSTATVRPSPETD